MSVGAGLVLVTHQGRFDAIELAIKINNFMRWTRHTAIIYDFLNRMGRCNSSVSLQLMRVVGLHRAFPVFLWGLTLVKKLLGILKSRWLQFVMTPFFIFVWFWLTDPSGGADTLLRIQLWAQAFLITGVAYLISKAMLGSASSESLFEATLKNKNTGAGIAYAGICLLRAIIFWGLLSFFANMQR